LFRYQDYHLPRDANRKDELGAERLDGRLLADLEAGPHPQEVALLVAERGDEILGPLDDDLVLVADALALGRLALPVPDGPVHVLLALLQLRLLDERQLLRGPLHRHRYDYPRRFIPIGTHPFSLRRAGSAGGGGGEEEDEEGGGGREGRGRRGFLNREDFLLLLPPVGGVKDSRWAGPMQCGSSKTHLTLSGPSACAWAL